MAISLALSSVLVIGFMPNESYAEHEATTDPVLTPDIRAADNIMVAYCDTIVMSGLAIEQPDEVIWSLNDDVHILTTGYTLIISEDLDEGANTVTVTYPAHETAGDVDIIGLYENLPITISGNNCATEPTEPTEPISPNESPVTRDIAVTAVQGSGGTINFDTVTDDSDMMFSDFTEVRLDLLAASGEDNPVFNIFTQVQFVVDDYDSTSTSGDTRLLVTNEMVRFTVNDDAAPGIYNLEYRVTDSGGLKSTANVIFTITELETTTLTPDIPVTAVQGASGTIDFSGIIDGTDLLHGFTLVRFDLTNSTAVNQGNNIATQVVFDSDDVDSSNGDPSTLVVTSETLRFTVNDEAVVGTYNLGYTATDDDDLKSTGVVTFTITAPVVGDSAPVIGDSAPQVRAFTTTEPTAGTTPERSNGGASSDWKKKPTFGTSWETLSEQLVENGLIFNGYTLNIDDNWHTDFIKTSSIIGEKNNVSLKAYAPDDFKYVTLALGVPEIGKVTDSETDITLMLNRNYTNPEDYDITEIIHNQKENLINETSTLASVEKSMCNASDTVEYCYTFNIEFSVNAPLTYDIFAIQAVDSKRRLATTYLNDGVEFVGTSLLAPNTHTIMEKTSSQDKPVILELTQLDRRYAVYEDQFGATWTHNDHGSWQKITPDNMVRDGDYATNVMTRQHSAFDGMVMHEINKATQIFDSGMIQNELSE